MMPNKEDYKILFRWDGMITCLHSELFIKAHHLGDPLVVFAKGSWHTFLSKAKEKVCLEKGLELYKDKRGYQEYSETFRRHIAEVKNVKISEKVTEVELRHFIGVLAQLFEFYALTEFIYTDLAFFEAEKKNDSMLLKNLNDLSKLKVEGREALNSMAFEHGFIHSILTTLSRQFLWEEDDAFFLYSEELLDLFKGKLPEKNEINSRKKCYATAKIGDSVRRFSHSDSMDLAEKFIEIKENDVIKGSCASKGNARGLVVIAPMLTDMKKVNEVLEKMKVGNILVAQSTTPELMGLIGKAAAIVADQGGMLSHAAVVSREFNIPCIVGTGNATRVLRDGDLVEVDADKGIVRKIN